MKVIKARVTEDGKKFVVRDVELFTQDETDVKLRGKEYGKDWDIGYSILDPKQPNNSIGWTVELEDGNYFFCEKKHKD